MAPQMLGPPAPHGPARFFAAHPGLHTLSMAAAAGAAAAMAWRSLRAPTAARSIGWAALAVLELDITLRIAGMPWRPRAP